MRRREWGAGALKPAAHQVTCLIQNVGEETNTGCPNSGQKLVTSGSGGGAAGGSQQFLAPPQLPWEL